MEKVGGNLTLYQEILHLNIHFTFKFSNTPFFLKDTFDGEHPECIVHSMFMSQRKLKKENGGIDVLSDRDVFNQSRALIGAGWFCKMNC